MADAFGQMLLDGTGPAMVRLPDRLPDEMESILEGTRWGIRRLVQESGSGYYVAVLE